MDIKFIGPAAPHFPVRAQHMWEYLHEGLEHEASSFQQKHNGMSAYQLEAAGGDMLNSSRKWWGLIQHKEVSVTITRTLEQHKEASMPNSSSGMTHKGKCACHHNFKCQACRSLEHLNNTKRRVCPSAHSWTTLRASVSINKASNTQWQACHSLELFNQYIMASLTVINAITIALNRNHVWSS